MKRPAITMTSLLLPAGWRTQITYPDGKTEQFGYDGNSRLTNALASAFGLSAVTYGYDSRDNLTSASLPGGLLETYAYDAMSRFSSWSVSKAGSNLLARSCTRNGLGFRETETIQAGLEALDGPASQNRQHNAADRITSVLQGGPAATNLPSFDPCGNMTQIVLSVKGQTFTTQYRYDADNKLLGVTRLRNGPQGQSVTTSVVQLEYDAQGLLLRITENGTVRRLVRDRTDQLARPLAETDSSGNPVRWFVWANGRLLAQVQTNGAIRVAHFDELGRLLALTDGSGMLTDEFAFSPYGRVIGHSGTTTTPFTFLGSFGVWDVGHGLYLTRHRAYDANLARFIQTDPLGISASPNLYVYGSDNPLAFLDPLGLCADSSYNGQSWGQGGPSSSSYYDAPVLRAGVNASYLSSVQTFAPSQNANSPAAQRQAELAAAPFAVVGAPFAITAGSIGVSEAAVHGAVAYATYSPISVPTTIKFVNGLANGWSGVKKPSDDPISMMGGMVGSGVHREWDNYQERRSDQ